MKKRPLLPGKTARRRRFAAVAARKAAARMRARAPRPARALVLLVILALGAALGSGLYEYGLRVAGISPQVTASEVAQLRAERERLQASNQALTNRLNAADSRVEIERAANERLSAELRQAQLEAGNLRNDLAFFEQLIPADPRAGQVSIRSAELERQGQALRYRVLLMRAGRPGGEFQGTLQFSAVGTRAGSNATANADLVPLVPPGAAPGANLLALSFRQYQRAEGTLELPAGFTPRSITVRVLEGGAVRSQSTVHLPG